MENQAEIIVRIKGRKSELKVPVWTRAAEAFAQAGIDVSACPACFANNELVSLSRPLEIDTYLEPLDAGTHQARSIYRQTLSFVLSMAASQLRAEGVLPESRIAIGHSLGYSFYYSFAKVKSMAPSHIMALETRMKEIVEENLPVVFHWMPYKEARHWFLNHDRAGTASLLEQRDKWRVPVYRCGDYMDLLHWPLLQRTGLLRDFSLEPYEDGFLLRFPDESGKLGAFPRDSKIFQVYKEYKKWGRIEGVHSAAALNELISTGKLKDFIRIAEAFHAKKLSQIADLIYQRRGELRVVLIAGPSSSGKTTSAKRLAIELAVNGLVPHPLSLDNYYNPPEMAPKDAGGKPDLEALEALDVPLLNEQLVDLMNGKEVTTPVYNFHNGMRTPGPKIKLGRRDILIVEGIHGLNDALTPHVPRERKFKLYVSALTQLNIDDENRVSTSDNRILRRIVRDYQFRGASAARSIALWPSVRRGEEKNIFPYQDSADAVFNSALDYELAILKFYAEPLLRAVPQDAPEYPEAARLLAFLANFSPAPPQGIPPLSILREFIGGSEFKY
jgi:uridine kinase